MDPESNAQECAGEGTDDIAPAPRISQWIWRPWYARLWWALIPIYWSGAAIAPTIPHLEAFYSSALAGFINVFMFPPTAFFVLSAGYLRERIGPIDWSKSEPTASDHPPIWGHQEIGRPPPELDPLNPSSGAYWIGSPGNPISKHWHH